MFHYCISDQEIYREYFYINRNNSLSLNTCDDNVKIFREKLQEFNISVIRIQIKNEILQLTFENENELLDISNFRTIVNNIIEENDLDNSYDKSVKNNLKDMIQLLNYLLEKLDDIDKITKKHKDFLCINLLLNLTGHSNSFNNYKDCQKFWEELISFIAEELKDEELKKMVAVFDKQNDTCILFIQQFCEKLKNYFKDNGKDDIFLMYADQYTFNSQITRVKTSLGNYNSVL